MKRKKWFRYVFVSIIVLLAAGLCLPEPFTNPVEGATRSSYNIKSFWFYPWGKSGTHKGVDIFAKANTPVNASVPGFVVFTGEIERGGKVVILLGPKWRVHYYAHLNDIQTRTFSFRRSGQRLGTVGNTGNARSKPAHLHYSITTLVPYIWKADTGREGWKKMFYLNPVEYLEHASF